MSVSSTTILFFDASRLVAAAGSPNGGSGLLLSLCARGFLRGAVSQHVMLEAERNIETRLKGEALQMYHHFVAATPLIVAAVPVPIPALPPVNAKDLHVVTAAILSGASYLIALDKRLIAETNAAQLSLLALTPGDFIKSVLPTHVDYPAASNK